MYFAREEKVFSLAGTSSTLQRLNLPLTWQEFFGYLIVAGLYLEGQNYALSSESGKLSNPQFALPTGRYANRFGRTIATGLSQRWYVLYEHSDTTPAEKSFLEDLSDLFVAEARGFKLVKAQTFLTIAQQRELGETGRVLAHYASVMFGQSDFAEPLQLPKLYLSRFGNIHLCNRETLTLGTPRLVYSKTIPQEGTVTALWALASSLVGSIEDPELAPEQLFQWLAQLAFLSELDTLGSGKVTFPQAAASASAAGRLGLYSCPGNVLVTKFYHELVWHSAGQITILNYPLFKNCLDLMIPQGSRAEWIGDFVTPEYKRLLNPTVAYAPRSTYQADFGLALEALEAAPIESEDGSEAEPPASEQGDQENTTSMGSDSEQSATDEVDVPETDPEHNVTSPTDGEYDPAVPPAAPTQDGEGEKDTIGLISFDTTGEGVDADLYRSAVLALRSRLQSDDSVPVTAETKDSLNYWVNSFLYRASISATQNQIDALGLTKYLKNVATKGK